MKTFLNEKTRQGKIIDEVQKKRNLFGLGLTSLIAACSAADNATENGATGEVGLGTLPTKNLEAADAEILPKATKGALADRANLTATPTAGTRSGKTDLVVTVKTEADDSITSEFKATFKNGDHGDDVGFADLYTTLTAGSDLVVSAVEFGTPDGAAETGAIYIFWNMGTTGTIADADADTKHLKISGDTGDVVHTGPLFYHIGGDTAAGTGADQPDILFISGADAATVTNVNILWDVTKHAGKTDAAVTATLGADDNGILQIKGAALLRYFESIKVNNNEDYDMVVADLNAVHILWDGAKYHHATAKVEVNLADPDAADVAATHGLLTIAGLVNPTGAVIPEFTKINNNDGYDMLVKGAAATYILWDVAKYHDAADAKTVAVSLTAPAAKGIEATHGLLTITGAITDIHKATATIEGEAVDNGFTDINKGGINDIAFTDGTNTYILFGEKVADRDGEKAKSYSVDLAKVTEFFESDTTKAGLFDLDLDGDATTTDVVKDVGYRFAAADQGNVDTLDKIAMEYANVETPAVGGLSQEAYWDVA